MKKIALALIIVSILATAPIVYAHENEGKQHLSFTLSSQSQNLETEENNEGSEFEIKGTVESVAAGGESFVVNGKTIVIDPSKVDEFKQKGIIDAGDKIKVEGEIIDGTYYAEEIMTIGEGQGRFKFEVKSAEDKEEGDEEDTPTPTETSTPTPTPSETISPTPSETVSPTPTESTSPTPTLTTNTEVNVSARGPIALVTQFLEQVLTYLKGLIS